MLSTVELLSYERIRDSVFRYLPTVDQVGAIPREHLISDVCAYCVAAWIICSRHRNESLVETSDSTWMEELLITI